MNPNNALKIAFIGGGNMASAIIGGLLKSGTPAATISVVEPSPEQRAKLAQDFAITALPQAGPELDPAQLVVWAVKPQLFKEAATPCAAHTASALHLSVAAGIASSSIAAWLGSERIVRAMPNTPALVGQGMTGLFARSVVSANERGLVERVLAPTGELMWLADEAQLDAVTALSGSGPAYVFYFIEAMIRAGQEMGLTEAQATQLAKATFSGASTLAKNATEPPHVLRARVTSKGGTTHAAITSMQEAQVAEAFMRAMHAAREQAVELGREFGA
jgi:pyrroline-5-carboxylate reductase